MKKTPSIIDAYYKSLGTKIFRDTTALPFADGGPLNDRNIHGDLLPSVYASALGRYYGNGGMIKRADGSYSKRGLWDNIRDNAGSGKEPTKEMLSQERKINNKYGSGGQMQPDYSLPEDSFQQGGRGLKNSVYASSMGQYPAPYAMGGAMNPGPGDGIVEYNGFKYKKDSSGNWINATSGAPVADVLLSQKINYEGKPVGTSPVQSLPKPNPISPITNRQEYNTIKNSPVLADQNKAKQLEKEIRFQDVYYPEAEKNLNTTTFEGEVNNALGNPMNKAEISAEASSNEGQVDNFRHANAGRYTTEAIADMTGNIPYLSNAAGFIGTNLLGLGHEVKVMFNGMEDRPWSKVLRESGEDLYNNFVGAKTGASDMTPEQKTNYLLYLSNNNKIPDGVVSPIPGSNQYLKHSPTDKGSYNSNYAQGGAMNQYPGGGPIYTYAKRPGSYYQKDENGQWLISNKGTDGQYVPVDDPSGQRTAALNKGAVVSNESYAFGGELNYQYPDGGILGAASNLVPTTPVPEGPVIPGEQDIRDFYTNWYSKRTLPFDEIGNKQYEKTMKSILPAYNPESTLLNEINANKLPYEVVPTLGDGNAEGAIVYNKKGLPEKIELGQSIMNNPRELNATMTHEERTRIMAPYADKVYPAEQKIIQPSIKSFDEIGRDITDPEHQEAAGNYYDYLTNPQEDNIQSMLFEIRQQKNLQPDQVITDEDIENWKLEGEKSGELDKNSPNFNGALYNLFKVSKDNSSMKNLFNYIASDNTPKSNNMNMFPTYGGNFV